MAAIEPLQTSELYGTSKLIADDGHGEKGDIILVPHPSSDVNDPLNWSAKKKGRHLAIIGFFTFFSGAIMSGPIAGWQYTTADTGITTTELNYGYAIAILFCGLANYPWTIIANCCGRRTTYLICSLGACLCSIWTAKYNTVGSYYAKSVFIGSFTAPFEGMTMTIVGDLYFLHERGLYMALVFLNAVVGTDLGTIAASFISSTGILDWRWNGWISAIAFAVSFLLILFFFEETRYVRIPSQVAGIQSASASQSNKEYDTEAEKVSERVVPPDVETGAVSPAKKTYQEKLKLWSLAPKGYRQSPWEVSKEIMVLFTYPAVIWAGCIYGINVAVYACVLSMLGPVIEVAPYNFTAIQFGLTRFGTIIGTLIALVLSGPLSDVIANYMSRRNNGVREAEHRLPLFILGMFTMPGCLLIFGLSAAYRAHWFGIVFGEALSSFSYTFTSELAMNYVVDCYRPVAVESFVGVIVIRNLYGFALTFAISPWMEHSGVRDVSIALAAIAFVLYASTLPMYIYGKRLRIWTSTRYPLVDKKTL